MIFSAGPKGGDRLGGGGCQRSLDVSSGGSGSGGPDVHDWRSRGVKCPDHTDVKLESERDGRHRQLCVWRLLAERACYAVCGCRSLFAETGKLINSQCARLFLHHAALCWPASFSKNIKM